MAYGEPSYGAAPRALSPPLQRADGGGAISALRASFAAAPAPLPPRRLAPPGAYAARRCRWPMTPPTASMPATSCGSWSTARKVSPTPMLIDAGGSITMPLIGAVPARGRTPAGLASEITGRLRNGYIREPSVAVEIEVLPAVLYSRRGRRPRAISLRTQHERRKRGRDRRRLLAARQARPRHAHPHRRPGSIAPWCRSAPAQPRRYRPRRRTLVLNSVFQARLPASMRRECTSRKSHVDESTARYFFRCLAKKPRLRGHAMSALALS